MAALEDLNTDLSRIDEALKDIITGDRVTRLVLGSGMSKQEYEFSDITPEFLEARREKVLAAIRDLEGSTKRSNFRTTVHMMKWSKK